jgi:hypothetical protein
VVVGDLRLTIEGREACRLTNDDLRLTIEGVEAFGGTNDDLQLTIEGKGFSFVNRQS